MLARLRLPVLAALAALLAGCFQVDAVLTVQPDGSAELVETVSGDGMMGLALLGAFGERAVGSDQSARLGEGVTVTSIARDAAPGRARLTTVYAVPDVSALRYSLQNAVDAEMLASTAMTGGGLGALGEAELEAELEADAAPDTTAFTFSFAAARGGQPAELRVVSPGLEIDTPEAPGMGSPDQTEQDEYEMALVMAGGIQKRLAVQIDGTLEGADRGWTDGNRVTLMDVDFGPFLEFAFAQGGFEDPALAALVADGATDGLDLPGYRSVPPGTTTIRFR